jgi:hypothetical protein
MTPPSVRDPGEAVVFARCISVSALIAGSALGFSAAPPAAGAAAVFHRPLISVGASQSSNWSGYNQGTLEQGGTQFHSISSTWVVPTATLRHAGQEHSSNWIGIGGGCVNADCSVTDSTLIQAGTEQDVSSKGAHYSAWWEIIPEPSTRIPHFKVRPGDTMQVTIAETTLNSQMWDITVANLTTGKTFTTSTPYTSSYATAEWIVETPVVIKNGGHVKIGPLPKLSMSTFDDATVNGVSPNLQDSEQVQLVNAKNQVIARPSSPDAEGDGFNLCTFASTCPAP